MSALEHAALRRAFGAIPSGVVALAGADVHGLVGMAVSTFVPVSLDPPLAAVCVTSGSRTWPRLRALPRIGLSALAEDQPDVAASLASRDGDRFAPVPHRVDPDGSVAVLGAAVHFSCSLSEEVVAGDHLLVLLRIEALTPGAARPLVFHTSTYTALVRDQPASPPAPTTVRS